MAGTTNPKKPGNNGGGGQSPTDIIRVWLEDSTANSKANKLLTALTTALQSPTDPFSVSLDGETAEALYHALDDALNKGGGGQSPTDIPVWLDVATAQDLYDALDKILGRQGTPPDPITVPLDVATAKVLLSALSVALSKPIPSGKKVMAHVG